MGKYEESIRYLKRLLLNNPKNELTWYSIALCYELVDGYEKAISFIKKFINHYPYNHIAWHYLGIVYQKKEDYLNAIEAYDYALLINENTRFPTTKQNVFL